MNDAGDSQSTTLVSQENSSTLVSRFEIFSDAVDIVEFEETQPLSEPLSTPAKAATGLNTKVPSSTFALELQKLLQGYPQRVRNVAFAGHSGHGKTSLLQCLASSTHSEYAKDMLDCTMHEKSRAMTLMARPLNLVTRGTGQSLSLSLIDTPGHADFWDELEAGLGLADAVLVVLDAAEPVMPTARRALKTEKPAILCINKIDRLLVEMKMSPMQAAQRLEYLLEQLPKAPVVFASAKYRFSFTRESIAALYTKYAGEVELNYCEALAKYGLEPIQKLFKVGLSGEYEVYKAVCQELGVKPVKKLAAHEKLVTLFAAYFENPLGALVDSFNILPDLGDAKVRVHKHIQVGDLLYSYVRTNSTLVVSDFVQGAQVTGIYIPCASYFVPVEQALPGNIYLVQGLGDLKTCAVSLPVPLNVGVDPASAKDRAALEATLDRLQAVHQSLEVNVNATGEIIVSGPGELYLDYVLAQVREYVQVKLTQPSVQFRETLLEPSFRPCLVSTFDGAASVTVSASTSDRSCAEFEGMPEIDITGALCEQPIRGVKFTCSPTQPSQIDVLTHSMLERGCRGALLLGKPAILEPLYRITAISSRGGSQLYSILRERRGKVLTDDPVPGTSLFLLTGLLPCLDSLGFETQAMGHLHGQLRLVLEFEGWQLLPGDALEAVTVPKMKMADNLARDVVLKLRKRKGLSYEPSLKQLVGTEAMMKMGFEEQEQNTERPS